MYIFSNRESNNIWKLINRLTSGFGAALLLWPVIQERYHLNNKVHQNPNTACPTAKTGLLGGGAFVSLDSALLWIVNLMMATNIREDYFEYVQSNYNNDKETQVITFD